MPRRALSFCVSLGLASSLAAQTPGAAELSLGLQAAAQKDAVASLEHLARATGLLDPEHEKVKLAQAYLYLGLTYFTGLDRADLALPAFVRSGELGATSSWLWAAMAAEKMGGSAEEVAHYRAMAQEAAPAGEQAPHAMEDHAAPPPAAPAPVPTPAEAFEHFFGEEKPKPPAPATPKAATPQPSAPQPAEDQPADAFQYFFGKKKPAPPPPPPG